MRSNWRTSSKHCLGSSLGNSLEQAAAHPGDEAQILQRHDTGSQAADVVPKVMLISLAAEENIAKSDFFREAA